MNTTPATELRRLMATVPGLTQERLAKAIRVSRLTVNEILHNRRRVTAATALRLARAFPSTTAHHWMSLQQAVDLAEARVRLAPVIETLPRLIAAEKDWAW